MTLDAYDSLLQTLARLADIPPEQQAAVVQLFRAQTVPAQTTLLHAGERPQTLSFVVSGLLRLYYLDAQGTEYTKSFCVEHEFVAAYSALLLQQPSRLYIETLEPSQLLVADFRAYQNLSVQHPCWLVVNSAIAQYLFIKKEQREASLLLDDAQTRYQAFLAEYPQLEQRVKQYQIASYLGITPVSLSRIRARLD